MKTHFLETDSSSTTPRLPKQKKPLIPFALARKFARSLGLKSRKEWVQYCKAGKEGLPPKPYNLARSADMHYRFEGWKPWEDCLGMKK